MGDTDGSTAGLIVTTSAGAVQGTARDGTIAFLGIPYAAPPIGPAAFQAPAPPPAWDGVRDATAYGPTAPQVGYPAPIAALLDNDIELGDDYLTVNVWTRDPSASGLPSWCGSTGAHLRAGRTGCRCMRVIPLPGTAWSSSA